MKKLERSKSFDSFKSLKINYKGWLIIQPLLISTIFCFTSFLGYPQNYTSLQQVNLDDYKSSYYFLNGQYDSALVYKLKAMENPKYRIVTDYFNLADIYYKLNMKDSIYSALLNAEKMNVYEYTVDDYEEKFDLQFSNQQREELQRSHMISKTKVDSTLLQEVLLIEKRD